MENKLTEFIGFACVIADGLNDIRSGALPDGVVQKIIAISKEMLGVHIDGVELALRPRGHTVVQKNPTLEMFSRPRELTELTSKYYTHDGEGFHSTEYFRQRLPELVAKKDYFEKFESALTELLKIWRHRGGLAPLVFISLALGKDGGVAPLVADIEHIVVELQQYVRHTFYHGRSTPPARHIVVVERARYAHASLREKLQTLRVSEDLKEQLRIPFSHSVGQRIQQQLRFFPQDCTLWDIFDVLGQLVRNFGDVLLEVEPPDLPLFQTSQRQQNRVARLHEIAATLLEITRSPTLNVTGATESEQIVHVAGAFLEKINQWLRALNCDHNETYLSSYFRDETVAKDSKNNIVYYDVRGYTKIQESTLQRQSTAAEQEFGRWLELIRAVVSNWTIVFDGLIDPAKGDSYIGYFETSSSALDAVGLSLRHIEYSDLIHKASSLPPVRLKAGVGESSSHFVAGQGHSTAVNHIAHLLQDLDKLQTGVNEDESVAFVLESFLEEHQQVNEFVSGPPITFRDGRARRIDHRLIVDQFLKRLIAGPPGSKSRLVKRTDASDQPGAVT